MPPQRSRNFHDDSKSEIPSARDRYASSYPTSSLPKNRRNGTSTTAGASNLKEVTTASQSANGQPPGFDDGPKIDWYSFDSSFLLTYKSLHHLNIPAAFNTPYNERMLSQPGVGHLSPTMARHKSTQRVSKDQLAMAVRKDFNAAMVSESETITSFLYAVCHQDKTFRMRFEPNASR